MTDTERLEMSEIEPTRREQAWLKRLRALIDSQPPNTHVYLSCGGGGGRINLMRCGSHGEKVMDGEGYDRRYIIDSVKTANWDGGDW